MFLESLKILICVIFCRQKVWEFILTLMVSRILNDFCLIHIFLLRSKLWKFTFPESHLFCNIFKFTKIQGFLNVFCQCIFYTLFFTIIEPIFLVDYIEVYTTLYNAKLLMTLSSLSTIGFPPFGGYGLDVVRIEKALSLQDSSIKFSAKWSHPVGVPVSSQ